VRTRIDELEDRILVAFLQNLNRFYFIISAYIENCLLPDIDIGAFIWCGKI